MPRTINADGRTITVPDDATPEEINQIVGPAPQASAPSSPQPEARTVSNYLSEAGRGVGRGLRNDTLGVAQALRHPLKTASAVSQQTMNAEQKAVKEFQDTKGATLPQRGAAAALTGLENAPVIGPMVRHAEQGGTRMASPESVGAAAEGITTFTAPEAIVHGVRGLAKVIPKTAAGVIERNAPRSVPIAGEKVPVLTGEAAPETPSGRLQTNLKRSGASAPKFEKIENAQQAAVKNVIRNVAQQTSELTGPMKEEPGAAMQDAASATFSKASPMYNALDASLKTVPDSLQNASALVKDAIAKARKLGIDIDTSGDASLVFDGKKITPQDNPGLWQRLKDQGVVNEKGEGTPLTAYIKIRSQLLKLQRSTTDPALRNALGDEARSMSDNMDKALEGTPLHDNWKEANRLWAKGYALRSVADAITDSTKGTPAAEQAPGLTPIQTKVQGAGLVNRLNDLKNDGTLAKAFSPEEARNLRESADILDRIQRTPVGRGQGESMSISRGLAHAVRGSKGPLIGAGIGFALGGGLRGAEVGAGIGFIVQAVGERALVGIMTRTDGVKALEMIEKAKTPEALKSGLKALAKVAPGGSVASALRPQQDR